MESIEGGPPRFDDSAAVSNHPYLHECRGGDGGHGCSVPGSKSRGWLWLSSPSGIVPANKWSIETRWLEMKPDGES